MYATQSSGNILGNRLDSSPGPLRWPFDLSILAERKSSEKSVLLFAAAIWCRVIVPRDMISFSVKLSGKFADLVYFPTTSRETRLEDTHYDPQHDLCRMTSFPYFVWALSMCIPL